MAKITSRATASNPCPVCGTGTKGCSATDDGFHQCRGEPQGDDWAKISGPDQYGFNGYRNDAEPAAGSPDRPRRRKPIPKIEIDWADKVRQYADLFPPVAGQLADHLRVPVEALALLPGIGYSGAVSGRPVYSFPERDARGAVTGITERFPPTAEHPAGEKKMRFGGSHGLYVTTNWRDAAGPVVCPEGASDTLALAAAGLAAVGRPSNKAGVELLAELFRDVPLDRDILVVGEHDRKPPTAKHPEGEWPGKEGAVFTAGRLSAVLGRPVRWTLPPPDAKDVRAWLTDESRAGRAWADRGAELLAHLVAHAEATEPAAPPDEHDDPGRWSRDVDESHRLAEMFLARLSPPGQPQRLRYWREEFHEWRDGCYHTLRTEDIKAKLRGWIHEEHLRVHALEVRAWETKAADGRGPRPKNRNTTISLVANVLAALGQLCLVSGSAESPCWLDGVRGPDPRHLLALRNGLYDLNAECFLPHSASYFSFAASAFDYLPDAPPPANWLRFLDSVWGDDPDSVACLQEWFGYLLTADTRQQKLLFLLGPTRAGKGTVATVLKHLVGPRNITNPTLSSFAGTYGLWPLVGRSVAVVSDARISGRTDSAQVVERILSVTGEDNMDVERKYLPPIASTKLNTRFVILSNELPNLADASSALVGRMILLRLSKSFYGSEDTHLIERLLADLPGILLWAVDGVRRLRSRGRFTQPASGADSIGEMREIASPVSAFVRDRCVLKCGHQVEAKELYDAWKKWCDETGRREHGTIQIFGRNLGSAFSGIRMSRPRRNGTPTRVYEGIRLKGLLDDEQQTAQINTEGLQPPDLTDLILGDPRSADNVTTAQEVTGDSHRQNGSDNKEDRGSCGSPRVATCESDWLYLSKRLELTFLPATQTLASVELGGVVYYRLTLPVLVWFEAAIADLDARRPPPDDATVREIVAATDAIYSFARQKWSEAEIDAGRAAGVAPLPDPPGGVL